MKNSNDASPRQPKEIFCVALLTARTVTALAALAAAQTDFANKCACDFGARRIAGLSFTSLNQAALKIATRHAM